MSHRINLSTSFNMSLGFIPVVVSILLCEFINQDLAIYIGTLTGVAYSLLNFLRNPKRVVNFILYISTAVLLVFSLVSVFSTRPWPGNWLPLTIEVSVIVPMLLVYLYKNQFISFFRKRQAPGRRNLVESAESSVVSIRVTLLFALTHFALITICVLFFRSFDDLIFWILLMIAPLLVFIFSIVFNQLGLNYFNNLMADTDYVPIVTPKGDVVSKIIKDDVAEQKSDVIIPIVRIAIESQGMLYLAESSSETHETPKIDTPLETFIVYKETVEQASQRLVKRTFPSATGLDPRFSIRYVFKNDKETRLVHLFFMPVADENVLKEAHFKSGKLWTLQQMEQNLDKNYFGERLEYEFYHLKTIIDTRERYKVS